MPCDTIQRSTVRLEAANLDLLIEALRTGLGLPSNAIQRTATGLRWYDGRSVAWNTYDVARKTLEVTQGTDIDALKRAYSAAVVRTAAKRFNWSLAQQDERHFAATKRF